MSRRAVAGEFELIERYLAPLSTREPGALGLTDDAALVRHGDGRELVVTADAIVAGVHFLIDDPPDLVARKLLRANLSDLAAMGASPTAYLVTLALPRETTEAWIERFACGLADDQAEFGTVLIGGDTVATEGPLVLSLTALGEVAAGAACRRDGARAGDSIYASGTIGDGALGLLVAKGGLDALPEELRAVLAERYRLPIPRLALGLQLPDLAHAVIDVSDGLVADLGHICDASGAGAVIEMALVPLSEAGAAAVRSEPELVSSVLTGGDDYELLFTAPRGAEAAVPALATRLALPLTRIGHITDAKGVIVLDETGMPITLGQRGYQHF